MNTPDLFASESYRLQAAHEQKAAHVGIVRQVFDWADIEKQPGVYDLTGYDADVVDLASRGLDVLPVLFDAPPFLTARPTSGFPYYPPTDPKTFGRFATALARRYGSHGTLWREHPDIRPHPIRTWQIWNEPDLPLYWAGHPDARQYVGLLREARNGLRAGDGRARVLGPGLAYSHGGPRLNAYIRAMMRNGARNLIDALAVDAYAKRPPGVIAELQSARRTLKRAGASRLPIWLTEFGWATGGPKTGFTVSPSTQARLIGQTVKALARDRCRLRLRGIVYYSWRDQILPRGDYWIYHTGLLRASSRPKPALAAFRKAVAGLGRTRCR